MPGHGEIDGLSVPKRNQEEKLASTVDLYIGIFFDGTNNNKYQVMLGKMFRWKEIYKKHRWKLKKHIKGWDVLEYSEVNMYSIVDYPRSYWESGPGKGIFNKSELEFMYFGYGDINDTSSGWRSTFVEQKSLSALEGNDINQLSAKPDDPKENEKLKEIAGRIANNEEGNGWIKDKWKGKLTDRAVKGAPAQNSTYTNVAILESLYKCEDATNDKGETTEKHISMYIEGSGADMQIEASTNKSHTMGHGIIGLGKGTGPSGAVSKVRKAVVMVKRLMEQFRPKTGSRTIKLHFDICGFSRGAACARMFCYVISPDNDGKTYYGDGSIANNQNDLKLFTGKEKVFLSEYTGSSDYKLEQKEIRNLLIADTVASIGVLYHEGVVGFVGNMATRSIMNTLGGIGKGLEYVGNLGKRQVDKGTEDIDMWGKRPYHYQNVNDYGLWATKLAKHVVHICAMDEVRQNFALTDIQSSIDEGNGTEIFIPGCHTDIGGGASIGMEDAKLVNVGLHRHLVSYHAHIKSDLENSNSESKVRPLNVETLKEIGWLNYDSKSTDNNKKTITGRSKLTEDETYYSENKDKTIPNIILYRHVTPGYSNVSLNCFKEMAEGDIFKDIPPSYAIPNDLTNLYEEIICQAAGSGRYFVYPNNPKQYYELRRKYLHFSFNEQLLAPADNRLVNGPEFTEITFEGEKVEVNSRIIYPGVYLNNDDSCKTRKHMFDYE